MSKINTENKRPNWLTVFIFLRIKLNIKVQSREKFLVFIKNLEKKLFTFWFIRGYIPVYDDLKLYPIWANEVSHKEFYGDVRYAYIISINLDHFTKFLRFFQNIFK